MIEELTDSQAAQSGKSYGGVYVVQVTSDEAAAAGIQSGDMIYSFDGTKVTSSAMLSGLLAEHSPGDKVDIVLLRDGEQVEVTTTLTYMQSN